MDVLTITPAYGRTYATPEAALQDWLHGKDFKILGGPYLSIRNTLALATDGWRGVAIESWMPTEPSLTPPGSEVLMFKGQPVSSRQPLLSIPLPTTSPGIGLTVNPCFVPYE